MKKIITIGIDIAKNVFQVHGIDDTGVVVVRRRLKRRQVLPFFGRLSLWTHPGNVEASYAVCIASASNLTGLVNASVECRRSGL